MLDARGLYSDTIDEQEHTPSFPADENEVEPDGNLPANCQVSNQEDTDEPSVDCDYVGDYYTDWVANLKKPFRSDGGCTLS